MIYGCLLHGCSTTAYNNQCCSLLLSSADTTSAAVHLSSLLRVSLCLYLSSAVSLYLCLSGYIVCLLLCLASLLLPTVARAWLKARGWRRRCRSWCCSGWRSQGGCSVHQPTASSTAGRLQRHEWPVASTSSIMRGPQPRPLTWAL